VRVLRPRPASCRRGGRRERPLRVRSHTRAHRPSPFDFTDEEWAATHELLLDAKAAWDERLAPDGYMLVWNCSPDVGHAHLHVVPRFDDEPLAGRRS
jgi:diadenosine tetraphosphate (Ap4A) HIT family hydrolase